MTPTVLLIMKIQATKVTKLDLGLVGSFYKYGILWNYEEYLRNKEVI